MSEQWLWSLYIDHLATYVKALKTHKNLVICEFYILIFYE